MVKKTCFEIEDAELLKGILNEVVIDSFSTMMLTELEKSPNSCNIFNLGVLLENVRTCISLELDINRDTGIDLHNLAQSEFIINKLIREYDLDDVDCINSKACFKELSVEFNEKRKDLVLDIMYNDTKINFALCRSDVSKKVRLEFTLHVGVELLLLLLCILMYIAQTKSYNNGYVSLLIILLGLKSLIMIMFNLTKHIKKYHVLKVIKHNKV